ncbi:enamine deaminase RidA (YjgF/YER057c/UK114 family) [Burkholderia ambifaria]|nr:RidA family protein [Burkholderia ambifaria]MDR6496933.1 enamine deaminase RidA (YjgF/YER057c/UK114 family) [Burkholderia ambifaria]
MNTTAPDDETEMIDMNRDAIFRGIADALGLAVDDDFGAAGRYAPLMRCDNQIFVSGQIPKLNGEIAIRGLIGSEVSVDNGRRGAMICAARCIALLQRSLGTLDRVRAVPRIGVYMQSDPAFEEHGAVADGASEVVYSVFGEAGVHARTSLSAFRLPRYAAVEVDLVAFVWQDSAEGGLTARGKAQT